MSSINLIIIILGKKFGIFFSKLYWANWLINNNNHDMYFLSLHSIYQRQAKIIIVTFSAAWQERLAKAYINYVFIGTEK